MREAPGEQKATERGKVTDSKNRDHADSLLKQYEGRIKRIVYGKFKGATDISSQDRQDIIIDVCYAFWNLVASGKFTGEHQEISIKACINAIATNKKNDFLVKFIPTKKLRAYDPVPRWFTPSGGLPGAVDPMIEKLPSYFGKAEAGVDPTMEHERKEGNKFIARETKYPEIIDSYRKGYSIKVIALTYGLKDEQLKKRIKREKKRLAKIAKQQGWRY